MNCKVIDASGMVQKAHFRRRRIYLKTTAKENRFFKRMFGIKKDCYVYITAQDERNCKCEIKKKKSCHSVVKKVGFKGKKFSMSFSCKAEAEFTFLKENKLSPSSVLESCRKMRISFDEYMQSFMRQKKAQKTVRKRSRENNFEFKTCLAVEEINSSEDKSTIPCKNIVEEIHPSSLYTPLIKEQISEELKISLFGDKMDFPTTMVEATAEKEIHPFCNELNAEAYMLSTNPLWEGEIQDSCSSSYTANAVMCEKEAQKTVRKQSREINFDLKTSFAIEGINSEDKSEMPSKNIVEEIHPSSLYTPLIEEISLSEDKIYVSESTMFKATAEKEIHPFSNEFNSPTDMSTNPLWVGEIQDTCSVSYTSNAAMCEKKAQKTVGKRYGEINSADKSKMPSKSIVEEIHPSSLYTPLIEEVSDELKISLSGDKFDVSQSTVFEATTEKEIHPFSNEFNSPTDMSTNPLWVGEIQDTRSLSCTTNAAMCEKKAQKTVGKRSREINFDLNTPSVEEINSKDKSKTPSENIVDEIHPSSLYTPLTEEISEELDISLPEDKMNVSEITMFEATAEKEIHPFSNEFNSPTDMIATNPLWVGEIMYKKKTNFLVEEINSVDKGKMPSKNIVEEIHPSSSYTPLIEEISEELDISLSGDKMDVSESTVFEATAQCMMSINPLWVGEIQDTCSSSYTANAVMCEKEAQKAVRKQSQEINFDLKTSFAIEEINSEDKSEMPSKNIVEEIHPSSLYTPLIEEISLSGDKMDFCESAMFEATPDKEIHPFPSELGIQRDILSTNPLWESEIQVDYNSSYTSDIRNNFTCPDIRNAVESLSYLNCKDVGPSEDAMSSNAMYYTEFFNTVETVNVIPVNTIPMLHLQKPDVLEQCSETLNETNYIEDISSPEEYVGTGSPPVLFCDIFSTVQKIVECIAETATDKPNESDVEIVLPFVCATQIIRFNESEFNLFHDIEAPFHDELSEVNEAFVKRIVETQKNIITHRELSVDTPGENTIDCIVTPLQNYNFKDIELSLNEAYSNSDKSSKYVAKKELQDETCLHVTNKELSNDSETELVDSIAYNAKSEHFEPCEYYADAGPSQDHAYANSTEWSTTPSAMDHTEYFSDVENVQSSSIAKVHVVEHFETLKETNNIEDVSPPDSDSSLDSFYEACNTIENMLQFITESASDKPNESDVEIILPFVCETQIIRFNESEFNNFEHILESPLLDEENEDNYVFSNRFVETHKKNILQEVSVDPPGENTIDCIITPMQNYNLDFMELSSHEESNSDKKSTLAKKELQDETCLHIVNKELNENIISDSEMETVDSIACDLNLRDNSTPHPQALDLQMPDVVKQCFEILKEATNIEDVSPPEEPQVHAGSPSVPMCDIFNTVNKMLESISETADNKPNECDVAIILPFVCETQIIRFNESEFNNFEQTLEPPLPDEDNDVFSYGIIETQEQVFNSEVSVAPPGENAIDIAVMPLQSNTECMELSLAENELQCTLVNDSETEIVDSIACHSKLQDDSIPQQECSTSDKNSTYMSKKELNENDSETEIVDSVSSDTTSQDDRARNLDAVDHNADVPEDLGIPYDNVNYFSDVDMADETLESSM